MRCRLLIRRLSARGLPPWGLSACGLPRWGLPAFVAAALLAGCAGPKLVTYTLTLPPATTPDTLLARKPMVISVSAITVPNDVDGTDVIVRDGSILRRSPTGRWASRLSVGVTSRLAERLAERYPQMLVTTTPVSDTPAMSIRINISRLDVGAGNRRAAARAGGRTGQPTGTDARHFDARQWPARAAATAAHSVTSCNRGSVAVTVSPDVVALLR